MFASKLKRRVLWAALTVTVPLFAVWMFVPTTCTDDCTVQWPFVLMAVMAGGFLLLEAWLAARGRLNSRPCPRCGHRVTNGQLDCRACGHQFG